MTRIAVLGESPQVDGWALGGAAVIRAAGPDAVGEAWDALPADIEIVVVTPRAAGHLGRRLEERLVVTLP